jgi:uroporphyrinogen decarboxylase
MTSRERIQAVIRHEAPDRIPIYGWVTANLTPKILTAFESVEDFEDHYEFDYAHLFGGPAPWPPAQVNALMEANPRGVPPTALLDITPSDPADSEAYKDIQIQIRHHKEERGRWVYVQTPGTFEALNGVFGIEKHLLYLAMYPDYLREVYQRQAEWNRDFAMHCLDIGIDQIHVSDDWGAQNNLMFSMDTWRDLIYPYHKITADAVKARGGVLSLHSDGNINGAIGGVIELGYDVVHPWQESAGMSLDDFRSNYRDKLTVMGGLDVQTTIGFGDYDKLRAEITRVLEMFRDGGLLYCTSHFVQDHCSMEELTIAFDHIYREVRRLAS